MGVTAANAVEILAGRLCFFRWPGGGRQSHDTQKKNTCGEGEGRNHM